MIINPCIYHRFIIDIPIIVIKVLPACKTLNQTIIFYNSLKV